jgi:hypothetical protein
VSGEVEKIVAQCHYFLKYGIFRRTLSQLCQNDEEEDIVEHSFPLRIAIPLVFLYLLLCAFVVHVFDYKLRGEEKEEGLNVSTVN